MDDDYWVDNGKFYTAVEDLTDLLRDSVKDEIKAKLTALTAENEALRGRLRGLDNLEMQALQTKSKYEYAYESAKIQAIRDARKEELGKLLQAIDERLYTVERVYTEREKCDRCDAFRRLEYTTPSGRQAFEPCDCADRDSSWEVVETAAHEVSRRDGALVVWWVSARKWGDDEQLNARVLKPADRVADTKAVLERPFDYSFRDHAAAQLVVDVLNGRDDG